MAIRNLLIGVVVIALLAGCMPAPLPLPAQTPLPPLATLPPAIGNDVATLCQAALQNQGDNWPRAIALLQALHDQGADCPAGEEAGSTLYATRIAYGSKLRADGAREAAQAQFEAALAFDATREEAVAALRSLGISVADPLVACEENVLAAVFADVPPYEPSAVQAFVTVAEARFEWNGQPFVLRGVNYAPPENPVPAQWLTTGPDVLAAELDLIAAAGFNVIRVPLVMDRLFQCAGSGAVPQPEAIERLDTFVGLAAARDLHLILTLNAEPDLVAYPLYENPPHTLDRMRYLVERYHTEAALLAWEVRAGGDEDYRTQEGASGAFAREVVLTWLAETAAAVRSWDPNHLVTAAWVQDETATAPYVDFVSLQHWGSVVTLRARLAALQAVTGKPVVLSAFGFSTGLMPESRQGQYLRETIQVGEYAGLAGWLVWTAFDTGAVPETGAFGLWSAGYEPKLALGLVQILLYDPEAETGDSEVR